MKNTILVSIMLLSQIILSQEIDLKYANRYFDSLEVKKQFSGQVLIGQNDSIVFFKSYGLANYETKEEFNDSTRYQIASLSKQFTASAILLLQEQRKLNIDSSFASYYPEFPYKDITIRHLLNHTSGLPQFYPKMTDDLDHSMVNGNEVIVEMLKTGKYEIEFEPGTKWQYCDISYCLLALLIEKLTGESYGSFLKRNLFNPADMGSTTAELTTDIRRIKGENLAKGYIYDEKLNVFKRAEEQSNFDYVFWLGGFYGDGSVVTSAKDLFKWRNALKRGNPLNKSIVNLLSEAQSLKNGDPSVGWGKVYALGWYILDDSYRINGKAIEHPGGHAGFRSRMTMSLDGSLTIIVLANLEVDKFWKKRILPKAIIKK